MQNKINDLIEENKNLEQHLSKFKYENLQLEGQLKKLDEFLNLTYKEYKKNLSETEMLLKKHNNFLKNLIMQIK